MSHPQGDGTDSLFGAEAGFDEDSCEGGAAWRMLAAMAGKTTTAAGDGETVTGNDISGADTGVFAPARRNNKGQFVAGTGGNPTGRSNADRALIRHIHASFQPAEVVQMIRDAYATAAARGSWRGQLEVARFITEYTIGKPVQRSVTVSSRAGELLQQLASAQLGPETIDGEAEPAE